MQITREYASLIELADAATANTDLEPRLRASREVTSGKWYGTKTWDEAYNMLVNGWESGFQQMNEIGNVEQIAGKVIDFYYDTNGEELDIGSYIKGEPECFLNEEDEELPIYVDLLVNVGGTSDVDQKAFLKRCLIVASVSEILQRYGYRVSITGVSRVSASGWQSSDSWYEVKFSVKRYEQMLDLYNMAFALGHPSMLRRIIFSVRETELPNVRNIYGFYDGGGYGSSIDVPNQESKNCIYFPKASGYMPGEVEEETMKVINAYHQRLKENEE